ncbi:MAG: four helix bundle protein [Candidatus Pacebacteria bacterium]|nr:four helix bundle protein [Candidatus Paceibacterota bacterium]
MTEIQKSKQYDLEDRTMRFSLTVREFVKTLPKSLQNFEDTKQLIRSSGSIGANYIEANEAISKKDFILRIRISRKEAKETLYWLKLIDVGESKSLASKRIILVQEACELMNILSAIMRKVSP